MTRKLRSLTFSSTSNVTAAALVIPVFFLVFSSKFSKWCVLLEKVIPFRWIVINCCLENLRNISTSDSLSLRYVVSNVLLGLFIVLCRQDGQKTYSILKKDSQKLYFSAHVSNSIRWSGQHKADLAVLLNKTANVDVPYHESKQLTDYLRNEKA